MKMEIVKVEQIVPGMFMQAVSGVVAPFFEVVDIRDQDISDAGGEITKGVAIRVQMPDEIGIAYIALGTLVIVGVP